MKLSDTDRHMMRLAMKSTESDGWAKVSKLVWPFVVSLPDELVVKVPSSTGGGFVKLTDGGKLVMEYC